MKSQFKSIDDFLSLLQGVEPRGNNHWIALCPCHNDKDPSLDIKLDTNKILLHDFGGCKPTDIIKTLGLTMSHLWLDDGSKPTKERKGRKGQGGISRVIARYVYADEQGKSLYRKLRKEPKNFEQERYDKGAWVGGPGCMKGVRRVLFDLPVVMAADTKHSFVYWVEGEKDAINTKNKLEVVATTCVEGAGSLKKWNPEYGQVLSGKDIVLIPDRDRAGIAHMMFIATHLRDIAKSVKILLLPDGYHDISDWLLKHDRPEFFDTLLPQAMDYTPELNTELAGMYGEPLTPPSTEAGVDKAESIKSVVEYGRDTDIGNAERLVKLYGDIIRYCYERKTWLVWNGKVWEVDLGAKINTLAKQTVLNIYREAANEPSDTRRNLLVTHARKSEADARIKAMLSRAESEPGIPVTVSDLDTDNWLLNCQNGIIDLRTGKLLPHDKTKLMTQMVATSYDPNAKCPMFHNFFDWVTNEDEELGIYIQRSLGYSLTGDISEQILFFGYGLGGNGKTTLLSTFFTLMGDYAGKLSADDLMVKDKRTAGGPKEGLANLFGKRYALGSEVRDGRRLDVGLVKDVTGGETINARHLWEREFKFRPTFKLWLYGNKKPTIQDTSLAVWRRVKEIPFDQTIEKSKRDKDLEAKLEQDELPGILAWAVLGCLDWQLRGFNEPKAVLDATESYKDESDILGEWIYTCCVLEVGVLIPKADLRDSYTNWCVGEKTEAVSPRVFKSSLEERGVKSHRGTGGKHYWKGIRLLTDAEIITRFEKEKQEKEVETKAKSDRSDKELLKGWQTSSMKENSKEIATDGVTNVTKVTNDKSDISDNTLFICSNCKGREYWIGQGDEKKCVKCWTPPEGARVFEDD